VVGPINARLKRVTRYLREAATLVRRRQFTLLWDKARRLSLRVEALLSFEQLSRACADFAPKVILLDSSLGGGVTLTAERDFRHFLEQGLGVLAIGSTPLGELTARLTRSGDPTPVLSGRIEALPPLPASVDRIEVHSLATFTNPEAVREWLLNASELGVAILVHWHDHFMLCPTRHLLDSTDQYCGAPDPSFCNRCLPKNLNCRDAKLRKVDMSEWRKAWGQLLEQVSEVRTFSPSSQRLLMQTWPDRSLPMTLVPYDISHISDNPIARVAEEPLHIGVIGRIAKHKGALQVAELAHYLASIESQVRISVFGVLEEPAPKKIVQQTGLYNAEELGNLCRDSGVNVFWLPSICPETFSYVLHEMKAMGLPILAYDVGAQADYLVDYPKGQVVALGAASHEVFEALSTLAGRAT
jgi:glycosyltransferase involved in cell wall biosynthesis